MTDPTPTPTRAKVEALCATLRKRADQIGVLLTDPPQQHPNAMYFREAADMIQALRERAEAAEAQLHTMKTAGIIEVAVRNPSVMEYMQNWEGRAERAERAEAAAWNDAIEAAGNLESIHGYSNAVPRHRIRALRRAAPTEGEA